MTLRATLDREVRFDERSRAFPVAAAVEGVSPRSFTWACDLYLDQGSEGACVGHGFAHDAAAKPVVRPVDSATAFAWYRRAKQIDEWAGEDYEGTSVLAGAKTYVEAGYAEAYRWSFSLAEFVLGLGYAGPAVLGVNWHQGMTDTNAEGFIRRTGPVIGGHCILANRVRLVWKAGTSPAMKREPNWVERLDLTHSFVGLHNSWGSTWGWAGNAFMALGEFEELLHEDGEALFPMRRQ